MTTKFNNGRGAVICNQCGTTIALGFRDDMQYIYTVKQENHIHYKGSHKDYCSKICQINSYKDQHAAVKEDIAKLKEQGTAK